jgi:hypothetical protein
MVIHKMAVLPLADSAENWPKFKSVIFLVAASGVELLNGIDRGERKLMGESLKVAWAEFSTLS